MFTFSELYITSGVNTQNNQNTQKYQIVDLRTVGLLFGILWLT